MVAAMHMWPLTIRVYGRSGRQPDYRGPRLYTRRGQGSCGAIVRLANRGSPLGGGIQREPSDANGRFRITNVPSGVYGVMAAVQTVKNGNSTSATLGFGEAARPGAAPDATIQGDATNLLVTVSRRQPPNDPNGSNDPNDPNDMISGCPSVTF